MSVRISNTQIKFKDEDGTYKDVNAISPEIPVARNNTTGLVMPYPSLGTGVASNGGLAVVKAEANNIKVAADEYRPIVPKNQHISSFYGLAKAAGDATQSASSNAVGEYTDEAKIAIQKMLGIYDPPWEVIRAITLTERTSIDVSVDDNGNPFELLQAFIYVLYEPDLASESSGYGRYYIYDANNDYVTAETGRYSAVSTNSFKEILFEKRGNMKLAHFTRESSTGNYGTWLIKSYPVGMKLNVGNIVRIKMNDSDFEPAGTKISIYGQRAY